MEGKIGRARQRVDLGWNLDCKDFVIADSIESLQRIVSDLDKGEYNFVKPNANNMRHGTFRL